MEILFFALSFLSAVDSARAAVSELSVGNASRVIVKNNVYYVYGGLGGDGTSCTDPEATCDTCASATTISICNSKRIHDSLLLKISFKSSNTQAFTTSSKLEIQVDGESANLDVDEESSSPTLSANTTLTAAITWGRLCEALGMSGGCTEDMTSPVGIKFGINADSDDDLEESIEIKVQVTGAYLNADPSAYLYHTPKCAETSVDPGSYEGFCDFRVFKGDQKVHVEDERADDDSFPSTGQGTEIKYVRFYFEADTDDSCDDSEYENVTLNSKYKDISVTESANQYFLNEHKISGLKNKVGYYFRMANVDDAGNVFYFSGDGNAPVTHQHLSCSDENSYAVPEEVEGLMSGKGCFIATAAFGSSLDSRIQVLRNFRDQVLLKSEIGRHFVKKYYEQSPEWAEWIKKNEFAKKTTQIMLTPVIAFTEVYFKFGLTFVLLALFGLLSPIFLLIKLRGKK